MMKIWGIFMAGCVLAFGVLLGMFLNQSKAAGGETQSAETMAAAESATDAGTDNAMAGEELPADIQSLIADSQENYAAAMRVFEEETAAEVRRFDGKCAGRFGIGCFDEKCAGRFGVRRLSGQCIWKLAYRHLG